MNIKLLLVVLMFIPVSMMAQAQNNAEFDRIPEGCDQMVFTKTEVKPSFTISMEAYVDSLQSYLLSKNVVITNKAFRCRFILTSHSQVLDARIDIKRTPYRQVLTDAILKFQDLLKPAVQNSHFVCSYVTFMIVFENDRINIAILQGS